MTRKECLDILDLAGTASRDEIVKAYRHLAQVWHPDRFPNNRELQQKAHVKLSKINEAYTTLIEGKATPDTNTESSGNERTNAAPNSAPNALMPYRDDQVRYLGSDPRLKPLSQWRSPISSEGVPAIIEVVGEGVTLVTFNGQLADEAMIYAETSLLAVEEGLNRWVHRGGSVMWPTDKPESLSPVLARLNFLDPEGILTHLIVVTLTFRNAYYAQLFVKRLQSFIPFEKWAPPPPPPKPRPAPPPRQAASSASGATSPVNQSTDTQENVIGWAIIGVGFLLMILLSICVSSFLQPTVPAAAPQPTMFGAQQTFELPTAVETPTEASLTVQPSSPPSAKAAPAATQQVFWTLGSTREEVWAVEKHAVRAAIFTFNLDSGGREFIEYDFDNNVVVGWSNPFGTLKAKVIVDGKVIEKSVSTSITIQAGTPVSDLLKKHGEPIAVRAKGAAGLLVLGYGPIGNFEIEDGERETRQRWPPLTKTFKIGADRKVRRVTRD